MLEGELLERVHHHRRRAHVGAGEPGGRWIVPRLIRAADVDRDHEVGELRSHRHGQIVDHSTVDAGAVADAAGREESRQRARGVHGFAHGEVLEAGKSPDDASSAIEVDCIHQQALRQRGEGHVGDRARAQRAQRLLEVDRGGAHALEQHAEVIEPEQVALADRFGASLEVVDGSAAQICRGDQCPDARARIDVGDDVALLQRAQHSDVRKPLETTSAEDQRDASSHG